MTLRKSKIKTTSSRTEFTPKHLALELLKETKDKSTILKEGKFGSNAIAQIETLRILQVLENFKYRLDKYGKLKLLPEIVKEFRKLLEDEVNENIVFVKSAIELTEDQIKSLKKKTKKLFGKELDIYVSVDPKLSGGLVLKYKDKLVDLSVESKVEDLVKSISKNEDN